MIIYLRRHFFFFLNYHSCIVNFVDKLGSTTFAPVKADIAGNIGKLEAAAKANPSGGCCVQHWQACASIKPSTGPPTGTTTLQEMIQIEIDTKTTTKKSSSTDALLWLKRALEFVYVFLCEVNQ